MPSRSPSKFYSLKYLRSIAEDNFYDRSRAIDFDPSEVRSLIYNKQRRMTEAALKSFLRLQYLAAIQYALKTQIKRCSRCKENKPFDAFSPDPSKVLGRKSHCRTCRRTPF